MLAGRVNRDPRLLRVIRFWMVIQLCSTAFLQLALIGFQLLIVGNPITVASQVVSIVAALLAAIGAVVGLPALRAGLLGSATGPWIPGAVFPPYVATVFPVVIAYAVPSGISWVIFLTILPPGTGPWRGGA